MFIGKINLGKPLRKTNGRSNHSNTTTHLLWKFETKFYFMQSRGKKPPLYLVQVNLHQNAVGIKNHLQKRFWITNTVLKETWKLQIRSWKSSNSFYNAFLWLCCLHRAAHVCGVLRFHLQIRVHKNIHYHLKGWEKSRGKGELRPGRGKNGKYFVQINKGNYDFCAF